ncbi:MAG: aminotransferase class IV [Actinobacteria bacterium]|nr:aminotransferase class IV [Actinomycetota bacterium]
MDEAAKPEPSGAAPAGPRREQVAGELACLDGRTSPAAEAAIPVTDAGLLRGDGVFEVIRVYDGRVFALAEHLDRLERSAANLRLPYPVPREALELETPALVEQRGGAGFDGVVRIVLTTGGRRIVITEPLPPSPAQVRLGFVTYAPTRVLDGIKSLSYAANMLSSRLARERGFDEALLVTPHGRVLEAPTASIFYVTDDGALCTPPLDEHILASITRDLVVRLAGGEERAAAAEELLAAAEAFIVSTTREVQPVAAIEDREFDAPGGRTRAAAAALRNHIEAALAGAA